MTESDTLPPAVVAPPKLTHEQLLEQMVQRLGVLEFNKQKMMDERTREEWDRKEEDKERELTFNKAFRPIIREMETLRASIKGLAEANAQVGS